jgi:hypothetical protein
MTDEELQVIEARARVGVPVDAIDMAAYLRSRIDNLTLVAEVRRLRGIVDGVAQKFLGTEHEGITRRSVETLPQAVESIRAHRDQLARWCGIQ